MNIKEVRMTGTVPPFFGQGLIENMTEASEGGMSDEDTAILWRWFGMPLTEMVIEFDTANFMADRYPFRVVGASSTSIKGIEHLMFVMKKAGAIFETAKAQDIEDGDGSWFQLNPKEFEPTLPR